MALTNDEKLKIKYRMYDLTNEIERIKKETKYKSRLMKAKREYNELNIKLNGIKI